MGLINDQQIKEVILGVCIAPRTAKQVIDVGFAHSTCQACLENFPGCGVLANKLGQHLPIGCFNDKVNCNNRFTRTRSTLHNERLFWIFAPFFR